MKSFSSLYALCVTLFAGWLTTGCAGNSGETTPQGTCRIQQYTAVSTSQYTNSNAQTVYTYDASGNLIKSVATIDSRPTSNTFGTQLTTTTITYTYDAAGFLTGSTSQQQNTIVLPTNATKTEQYTNIASYSYTNGRLTQKVENYSGTYVSPSGSIRTYEYGSDGNLSSITATGLSDKTYSTVWQYRNNQLIDYIEKKGATENRPFTIQDGLITKMVFPGTENELVVAAAFDNQKRAVRIDNYVNNQLTEYDVQTWTGAKPSSASLPLFKGFPVLTPSSFDAQTGVLATKQHFNWNTVSKTMQLYNESKSAVQTNEQGYITNAVITTTYAVNTGQNTVSTETYTYAGCQ